MKNIIRISAFLSGLILVQAGFGLDSPSAPNPRLAAELRSVFPDSASPLKKRLFLSTEQLKKLEMAASAKFDTRLISYYQGLLADSSVGFLFYQSAIIRTQPATFTVLLKADGSIQNIHILSFAEPPDYRPPLRWLELFVGRQISSSLHLGKDIPVTTGATLTAQMFTAELRKVAALFNQFLKVNK